MNKFRSLEDAIAQVSIKPSFVSLAKGMVGNRLSAFLKGSSESTQIAEDAIGHSVERLLRIVKRKGHRWDLHQQAIDTYGTQDCLVTRYLVRCVGNYLAERQRFWGINKETGKLGYKARAVQPPMSDDGSQISQDAWLTSLLEESGTEDHDIVDSLREIEVVLTKANLPQDVIDLVVMRGQGMTFVEISEKVGKNKDALRQQLKRAEDKIDRALQGYFTK